MAIRSMPRCLQVRITSSSLIRQSFEYSVWLCSSTFQRLSILLTSMQFLEFARRRVNRPFADVCGAVPDTFQVMRHPQQVSGALNCRGVLSHEGNQFAVYALMQRVNILVAGHDPFC